MNTQELPLAELPVGKGLDVTGKRIGLLTAIRPVEKNRYGNVWLFQCWCGRYAVRQLASVRHSAKSGHAPQCSECLAELCRGQKEERRLKQNHLAIHRFLETGALWNISELWLLENLIRKDLELLLGYSFRREAEPPELPILLWDNEGTGINDEYHRIASSMANDMDPERHERILQEGRAQRALDKYLADVEIDGLREYGKVLQKRAVIRRAHGRAA